MFNDLTTTQTVYFIVGLVALIAMATFGIFTIIYMVIEIIRLKKIQKYINNNLSKNPELQKEISEKIFGKMTDEEKERYAKDPNYVSKVNINLKDLCDKYNVKGDKEK